MVRTRVRNAVGGLFVAGAMLVPLGAAVPAPAANAQVIQGGLVDVSVGNVNVLNNARIGVAAQVAANVCDVAVGPVAVLATQVARTGTPATVCTTPTGPVMITQA